MTEAQTRAKELRAELRAAEAEAKAERAFERQVEREARAAEESRLTAEYREENYTATVGENSEYVGVLSTYGGVELAITEHRSQQASVTLSREDVLALIEALQQAL